MDGCVQPVIWVSGNDNAPREAHLLLESFFLVKSSTLCNEVLVSGEEVASMMRTCSTR